MFEFIWANIDLHWAAPSQKWLGVLQGQELRKGFYRERGEAQ